MARGRATRQAAPLSPPERGLVSGLRARRRARELEKAALADELSIAPVDHPGYLYAYGLPAPAKEREALAVLLGVPADQIPEQLTLNEVRLARSAFMVGASGRWEMGILNAAIDEIREHGGRRAPWNEDQRIGEAVTRVAGLLARGRDLSAGEIACQVSAAVGYRFGAVMKAPRACLSARDMRHALRHAPASGHDVGTDQEIEVAAADLHEALLTHPRIAARHMLDTLGLGRDSAIDDWMRVRRIIQAPSAPALHLDLTPLTSHAPQVSSPQALTLTAGALFALSRARRGLGLPATADQLAADIEWLETPNPDLADNTPASLISQDPKGYWSAVMTAARIATPA